MIRPLRQRHRLMVCALGVALPVAFVAGIRARQPVPVAASLPAELAANRFGKVVWTRADLWPDQRVITLLRRDAAGSVAAEFVFRALAKPDVLVYWVPGKESIGEALPDNARLLGALANRTPLPIPSDIRGEAGRFVLYSLAEHEVVATSNPFMIQPI